MDTLTEQEATCGAAIGGSPQSAAPAEGGKEPAQLVVSTTHPGALPATALDEKKGEANQDVIELLAPSGGVLGSCRVKLRSKTRGLQGSVRATRTAVSPLTDDTSDSDCILVTNAGREVARTVSALALVSRDAEHHTVLPAFTLSREPRKPKSCGLRMRPRFMSTKCQKTASGRPAVARQLKTEIAALDGTPNRFFFSALHGVPGVRCEDLQCLAGTEWLPSGVINSYLSLMHSRHDNSGTADLPRVHLFSTFFFTKLLEGVDDTSEVILVDPEWQPSIVVNKRKVAEHPCVPGAEVAGTKRPNLRASVRSSRTGGKAQVSAAAGAVVTASRTRTQKRARSTTAAATRNSAAAASAHTPAIDASTGKESGESQQPAAPAAVSNPLPTTAHRRRKRVSAPTPLENRAETRSCRKRRTTIMPSLAETLTVNYAAVRSWTARSRPLETADVLVVPVNEGNDHWLTIAISLARKDIVLLDSLFSAKRAQEYESMLRKVWAWVLLEIEDKPSSSHEHRGSQDPATAADESHQRKGQEANSVNPNHADRHAVVHDSPQSEQVRAVAGAGELMHGAGTADGANTQQHSTPTAVPVVGAAKRMPQEGTAGTSTVTPPGASEGTGTPLGGAGKRRRDDQASRLGKQGETHAAKMSAPADAEAAVAGGDAGEHGRTHPQQRPPECVAEAAVGNEAQLEAEWRKRRRRDRTCVRGPASAGRVTPAFVAASVAASVAGAAVTSPAILADRARVKAPAETPPQACKPAPGGGNASRTTAAAMVPVAVQKAGQNEEGESKSSQSSGSVATGVPGADEAPPDARQGAVQLTPPSSIAHAPQGDILAAGKGASVAGASTEGAVAKGSVRCPPKSAQWEARGAWQHGWTLRAISGVPQQRDGGSCGVFLLAFVDCILRGWWPSAKQSAPEAVAQGAAGDAAALGLDFGDVAALRLGLLQELTSGGHRQLGT